MTQFVLSEEAASDLYSIWEYLADNAGVNIADRIAADLQHAMEQLVSSPLIGHRREDLTAQPVRFWAVHSYYVIYLPQSNPLAIVRVVHAARDVPPLLDAP